MVSVRRWALCALVGLAACGSAPKDDPNSQASLDKLYAEAKDELRSGSYEKATKLLERVEGRAAGTLMGQQAMLELAWAQHKGGEKAQALATLDRFLKLYPSSAGADYALYLKGLVNFNEDLGFLGRFAGQDFAERDQQASRDALQTFRELVEKHPQSRYAEDSRLRIAFILNTLAQHEVHVARYYLTRGANVAAVNRAQTALTDYPNAPAAEEALAIMAQAYERLQLKGLSEDALRVLRKNFPNSSHLPGQVVATKPWWKFW
ncbi:outer membrane protein assembly factor BamD [Inhella gelatinilytica]|uniref:Outer membrane protein assembly factor BamD n=1 Tax=Inhella gelatinilytica TaxID=2795030 RepID=A0A931J0X9_9BURK|nr:outer membrane protein assembly factor BamD [Inhella gelatinilytica]MBH9553493.1 outer membrane protein assembly factor BamD [Inhella gelatinilytica]